MPLVRAALLGTGLAAAWVVVSLVAAPSSASADEPPDGLLGTVATVVGVVDGTLDAVAAGLVQPVVAAAGTPAAEVVDTAHEVAPAPAQPVVDAVPVITSGATDAAGGTLDAVDATLTATVAGLGSAVGDLAGGAPTGALADPVVEALDGVAGALPVVGPVLGDDTLGGLLGPVVDLADDTLGAVVGDLGPLPGDGVLPSLPDPGIVTERPGAVLPAMQTPGESGLLVIAAALAPLPATAAAIADAGAGTGPPGGAEPLGALAPSPPAPGDGSPLGSGAPVGGSASAGSGPGAAPGSEAALAAHMLDAIASLVLGSVDDALPSSPVFDTDTTPD